MALCQSLSGTGALRLAADFLAKFVHKSKKTHVYISDPTWGNHRAIFQAAGFETIETYRYYNRKTNGLDLLGYLEDVQNAPEGSIFVLHACAHNPTGLDPTPDEWKKVAQQMKKKNHILLLDNAYQGFATGDIEQDAWATRYLANENFNFLVCQSFAKNMGLYGERAGVVYAICQNERDASAALSQFKKIVRPMYSNPPIHGALTVFLVLSTPELYEGWKKEVRGMADRIKQMRAKLKSKVEGLGTPGDWSHIVSQIGMFCYTGLNSTFELYPFLYFS